MNKQDKSEMSFLDHLEELRWHIVRSLIAIIAVSSIAFIYKSVVFDTILMGPSRSDFFTTKYLCKFGHYLNMLLANWGKNVDETSALCLNQTPISLQNIVMAGQFLAHIKISIISGLVLAFPYILYEFWKFIRPALYEREKKHTRGAVFSVSLLFILGVLFGYFIISPLSINFLYNYRASDSIENDIQLMSYVSIVASISLASGILFELPSIIYFLSKTGLVTPKFLKKYRRHAIIIILVLSAIITPPDIFSQILVCIPILILYEFSIRISKRINNRRSESVAN